MELVWFKCKGRVWCELNKVDADHPNLEGVKGVYIIWRGEKEHSVLRINHGTIVKEIMKNKKDHAIIAFSRFGVYVTWAAVPEEYIKNVHSYLDKILNPIIKDEAPNSMPLEVNLPW